VGADPRGRELTSNPIPAGACGGAGIGAKFVLGMGKEDALAVLLPAPQPLKQTLTVVEQPCMHWFQTCGSDDGPDWIATVLAG
jgi:hypothetical protein